MLSLYKNVFLFLLLESLLLLSVHHFQFFILLLEFNHRIKFYFASLSLYFGLFLNFNFPLGLFWSLSDPWSFTSSVWALRYVFLGWCQFGLYSHYISSFKISIYIFPRSWGFNSLNNLLHLIELFSWPDGLSVYTIWHFGNVLSIHGLLTRNVNI